MYGPMPSRRWRSEVSYRTDLTKENLVGLPNQRTRTRDLAVMTISLTDIAADEIKSFVHKVLIFLI